MPLYYVVQFELEREKLETELEEERRSQKEREQHIREQQIKIDNLSNLVTISDFHGNSSEVNSAKLCRWNTSYFTESTLFLYIFIFLSS